MTADEFEDFARKYVQKEDLYNVPGILLYSPGRTVRKGECMILGYDPGGSEDSTVKDSLDRFKTEHSCYLDEEWAPGGIVLERGKAPHQVQLQLIADEIGIDLRNICATNIVFARSRRSQHLTAPRESEALCWPVIERLIDIVSPRSILSIGRNTSEALLRRLHGFSLAETIPANHSTWKCRTYERSGGRPNRLVEVPGLGVYKQIQAGKVPHVVQWVARAMRGEPL